MPSGSPESGAQPSGSGRVTDGVRQGTLEGTEGDPLPVTGKVPADDSDDEIIGKQQKHTRITIFRLFDIRPTIGIPGAYCKSCEEGIGKHLKRYKDRFDKAFQDAAGSQSGKKLEKLPKGKHRLPPQVRRPPTRRKRRLRNDLQRCCGKPRGSVQKR